MLISFVDFGARGASSLEFYFQVKNQKLTNKMKQTQASVWVCLCVWGGEKERDKMKRKETSCALKPSKSSTTPRAHTRCDAEGWVTIGSLYVLSQAKKTK